MATRVVTAHIPVELAEQVDRIAVRMERPKGWIIKQALSSWVALEQKRHQMTLEGLADVEDGKTVDHATVENWVRSLHTS